MSQNLPFPLPANAELPDLNASDMADMFALLQEAQQTWNGERIAAAEAEASAPATEVQPMDAPIMAEMMDLLQESQQVWNGERIAAREVEAEQVEQQTALQSEMMDLLQESQQVWNGARIAAREAEETSLQDDMLDLLQESQQVWNGERIATRDNASVSPVSAPAADTAAAVASGVDLYALQSTGGAQAIALWQYCVRSVNPDALFMLLLEEYRLRPTHQALLALFDAFCAPQALAQISAAVGLSHNSMFMQQIQRLREEWQAQQEYQQLRRSLPQEELPPPPRSSQPYRSLFDTLQKQLLDNPDSGWQQARRNYDPAKSTSQNLPGGDMTPAQRLFVTRIWQPRLRPQLVAAGFWKLATVE